MGHRTRATSTDCLPSTIIKKTTCSRTLRRSQSTDLCYDLCYDLRYGYDLCYDLWLPVYSLGQPAACTLARREITRQREWRSLAVSHAAPGVQP